MLVIILTMRKAKKATVRPKKPLRKRVVAPWTFLGSPDDCIYSQPAEMMLNIKISPIMKKDNLMRLIPPPVRISLIDEPGWIRNSLGCPCLIVSMRPA